MRASLDCNSCCHGREMGVATFLDCPFRVLKGNQGKPKRNIRETEGSFDGTKTRYPHPHRIPTLPLPSTRIWIPRTRCKPRRNNVQKVLMHCSGGTPGMYGIVDLNVPRWGRLPGIHCRARGLPQPQLDTLRFWDGQQDRVVGCRDFCVCVCLFGRLSVVLKGRQKEINHLERS